MVTAAAAIAAITIAIVFAISPGDPVLAPFGMGLGLFVIAGALTEITERTGVLKLPLSTALGRGGRLCQGP
jgi:cytochrome c-type biogenesis protein CcmF